MPVRDTSRGRNRRCGNPCKCSNRHSDPRCDCLTHVFVPKPPPYRPPPDYLPIVDDHRDSSIFKTDDRSSQSTGCEIRTAHFEANVDIAADVKEAFAPPSIFSIPEMNKDDPIRQHQPIVQLAKIYVPEFVASKQPRTKNSAVTFAANAGTTSMI